MFNILFGCFTMALVLSCNSFVDPKTNMSLECELNKVFTYPNATTINVCDDMENLELQGIDTYVGKIENADGSFQLYYDIGALAGNYVNQNDPKTIDHSINQEFWYIRRDSSIYITFPNPTMDSFWPFQPHNFVLNNLQYEDLVLDMMRTLETN